MNYFVTEIIKILPEFVETATKMNNNKGRKFSTICPQLHLSVQKFDIEFFVCTISIFISSRKDFCGSYQVPEGICYTIQVIMLIS